MPGATFAGDSRPSYYSGGARGADEGEYGSFSSSSLDEFKNGAGADDAIFGFSSCEAAVASGDEFFGQSSSNGFFFGQRGDDVVYSGADSGDLAGRSRGGRGEL